MKTFILAGLLGGIVGSALAVSAEKAVRSVNDVVLSNLTWTGEVLVGEPKVTLVGNAESIYQQILTINPNYDDEFGINTKSANKMIKRENPSPVSTDYTCAYGVLVDVTPIDVGIKSLYNIGTGICSAPAGSAGATTGGCTRLTCSSDASIWLCNDNDFVIDIACELIADNAVQLLIDCQTTTYSAGAWSSTVRGQIFASDRSWNVIINKSTC